MRYSIEPRDRMYVKGYGFLSFPKNIGKNLSNKYGQKLLDSAKRSTTEQFKKQLKQLVIWLVIPDKITNVSNKKSMKDLPNNEEDMEITTHKKIYISPEERQQIIDELRLVPKNY